MADRKVYDLDGDQVCLKHTQKRVIGNRLVEKVMPIMKLAMQGKRNKICPKCDLPAQRTCDLVNQTKDPGHDAMQFEKPPGAVAKIVKMDVNQNQAPTGGTLPVPQTPISPPVLHPSGGTQFNLVEVMVGIIKQIENFNVKDLTKFKKRDRLIKMLNKVKVEMSALIGEK